MAGTVICDYINSANVSSGFFGVGQTWQDVTASRVIGTTYTNSTGKPIMVMAETYLYASTSQMAVQIYIDGLSHLQNAHKCGGSGINDSCLLSVTIPNGSTYKIGNDGGNLRKWLELR